MEYYASPGRTSWDQDPPRSPRPMAGFLENLTGFVTASAPIYGDIKAKDRAYKLQLEQLKLQRKQQKAMAQYQPGGALDLSAGGTTGPGLAGWWRRNSAWVAPTFLAASLLFLLSSLRYKRKQSYRRNPSPTRRSPVRRRPAKKKAATRRKPVKRKVVKRKAATRRRPVKRKATKKRIIRRRR